MIMDRVVEILEDMLDSPENVDVLKVAEEIRQAVNGSIKERLESYWANLNNGSAV